MAGKESFYLKCFVTLALTKPDSCLAEAEPATQQSRVNRRLSMHSLGGFLWSDLPCRMADEAGWCGCGHCRAVHDNLNRANNQKIILQSSN